MGRALSVPMHVGLLQALFDPQAEVQVMGALSL
jgi:hypothetical protein